MIYFRLFASRQLNRDPARVVYLSANPKSYSLQPENAIPVSKWEPTAAGAASADSDTALLDLMPLLESIVRKTAPDARAVITSLKEEASREARGSAQQHNSTTSLSFFSPPWGSSSRYSALLAQRLLRSLSCTVMSSRFMHGCAAAR